jgi:hypothetical protein
VNTPEIVHPQGEETIYIGSYATIAEADAAADDQPSELR